MHVKGNAWLSRLEPMEKARTSFAVGGLRVLACRPKAKCISGFFKGDPEVRYRFEALK